MARTSGQLVRSIGGYEVVRMVGKGGLGSVYEGLRGGERFAIKVLNESLDDTVVSKRLAREYNELRLVEHPNVVRVLDTGAHDGRPFLVMEFVDGSPLRRYLDLRDGVVDELPASTERPVEDSVTATQDRDGAEVSASGGTSWLLEEEEQDSLSPVKRSADGRVKAGPLPDADRVALNRPTRVAKLRDVAAQICDGLACIHARGLVHRDVKPSNVLIDASGCAKLVDFGLVKSTRSSGNTTAAGRVVGTYRYMSPEQARSGRVDGRSDLYALGSVLYEMLSGRPPFQHQQTAELLHAIVYESPASIHTINPGADPVLAGVAERLLHKSPGSRPASAVDVARRLRHIRRRNDL